MSNDKTVTINVSEVNQLGLDLIVVLRLLSKINRKVRKYNQGIPENIYREIVIDSSDALDILDDRLEFVSDILKGKQ